MQPRPTGFLPGLLAVMAFGLTLPVTRFVSADLDPVLVGLGRAAVAGVVASLILWRYKAPLPNVASRRSLSLVAAGVVLGFPLFSSWAMTLVPASHGGVVLAILPLLTALLGRIIGGEHPSPTFWFTSLLGGVLVLLYIFPEQGWRFHQGDWLLLLAAISAAIGYAFGGKLARQIPGWQVICWALVFCLPITLPVFIWRLTELNSSISIASGLGFLYLSLISQLFAFFLWYRALALGGISRISQIQLLQLFVTLSVAAIWLKEPLSSETLLFAVLILATVLISQKLPVPYPPTELRK